MAQEKFSYVIIGVGGVGGFYGIRLANAGADVHFLLRSYAEYVKQHGLLLESPDGDIRIEKPQAYGAADEMPRCDVVCVCLKSTQNEQLKTILPAVVKPGGVVLVFQNGVGIEQEVSVIVPQAKVGGAACFLCSHKVEPGHVRHEDYGRVTFGAHSDGMEDVLARIAGDFSDAGIPVDTADDLRCVRWKKLMWNVPFNALTIILDTTTNKIMACGQTRQLCRNIMVELLEAGRAQGFDIGMGFADKMLDDTAKMTPYKPSMKLDFELGRPMELEYIYERPIAIARRAGKPMPRIETLCAQLQFLDERNRMDANRNC
jgi:2-dehydropantoate 2-reductase